MRKIDNYFDDPPESLKLAALTERSTEQTGNEKAKMQRKGEPLTYKENSIIDVVLKNKRIAGDDYKKRDDVKEKLLDIYSHCCAFCEGRVNKYDDIEHFRPKHGITDESKHIGYYWLGFVWSNLLLACDECNRSFKQNNFPIEGSRVLYPPAADPPDYQAFYKECHIQSPVLVAEKPLLLHPVLDNPAEYLEFHADGTVTARDAKLKGKKSIQHYGLSDWQKRSILIDDRKEIVEDVRKKVRHSIAHFENDNRLYRDVLAIIAYLSGKQMPKNKLLSPYSAMYRTCIDRFEDFFIHSETIYTAEQKEQLQTAVARVRAKLEEIP